jgi:hypothetical protein
MGIGNLQQLLGGQGRQVDPRQQVWGAPKGQTDDSLAAWAGEQAAKANPQDPQGAYERAYWMVLNGGKSPE